MHSTKEGRELQCFSVFLVLELSLFCLCFCFRLFLIFIGRVAYVLFLLFFYFLSFLLFVTCAFWVEFVFIFYCLFFWSVIFLSHACEVVYRGKTRKSCKQMSHVVVCRGLVAGVINFTTLLCLFSSLFVCLSCGKRYGSGMFFLISFSFPV